jgi:hypothetical protein
MRARCLDRRRACSRPNGEAMEYAAWDRALRREGAGGNAAKRIQPGEAPPQRMWRGDRLAEGKR